jgi:hypothetical protein
MRTYLASALALAALLAIAAPARASDPIGVYTLLEKVTLLPDGESPTGVVLEGAFAISAADRGDDYRPPRWGTLRFEIVPGKEDVCRREWADLAKLAGSGQVVGFGSRHRGAPPTLRAGGAKDAAPDPWPLGFGLSRVRNVDWGPVRALLSLPKPLAPVGTVRAESDRRLGVEVTLRAANARDSREGTRYVFTATLPSGDTVASGAVAPGDGETTWTVRLHVRDGERVEWTVCVIRDGLEAAPVARESFTVEIRKE